MKQISMPYDEYLQDIQAAKEQLEVKFLHPIRELLLVNISGNRTASGIPDAAWSFQGTKEELLVSLCKLMGMPTLNETKKVLSEQYGGYRR